MAAACDQIGSSSFPSTWTEPCLAVSRVAKASGGVRLFACRIDPVSAAIAVGVGGGPPCCGALVAPRSTRRDAINPDSEIGIVGERETIGTGAVAPASPTLRAGKGFYNTRFPGAGAYQYGPVRGALSQLLDASDASLVVQSDVKLTVRIHRHI